jgi:hypothetical protein
MIQEGSMGRGVRLTRRLPVSMSERGINDLKRRKFKISGSFKSMQPGEVRCQN